VRENEELGDDQESEVVATLLKRNREFLRQLQDGSVEWSDIPPTHRLVRVFDGIPVSSGGFPHHQGLERPPLP